MCKTLMWKELVLNILDQPHGIYVHDYTKKEHKSNTIFKNPYLDVN